MPVVPFILIAQLDVHHSFRRGGWVIAIVGEIVAFRLAVAVSNGGVGLMPIVSEADTGFRVHEVVTFADVELLVAVGAVGIAEEFVVEAIGLVVYIAVLQVGKDIPCTGKVIVGLQESAVIEFGGIGIVVFVVVAALAIEVVHLLIGDISEITEMFAAELLTVDATDDIPSLVLVVEVVDDAVCVLSQSFLAHEIGFLDRFSIGSCEIGKAELFQLVVISEFRVVSETIGIVQCKVVAPVGCRLPHCRENVVVLIEVVGGLVPIAAIAHLIALGDIMAIVIFGKRFAIGGVDQRLIEGVVSAQTMFVHVFVGFDAAFCSVCSVHERKIVVTGGHTVPRLSCFLEVADIFIAYLEIVAYPSQSSIVRSRTAGCAVQIAIGGSLMIGSVKDEVVP